MINDTDHNIHKYILQWTLQIMLQMEMSRIVKKGKYHFHVKNENLIWTSKFHAK